MFAVENCLQAKYLVRHCRRLQSCKMIGSARICRDLGIFFRLSWSLSSQSTEQPLGTFHGALPSPDLTTYDLTALNEYCVSGDAYQSSQFRHKALQPKAANLTSPLVHFTESSNLELRSSNHHHHLPVHFPPTCRITRLHPHLRTSQAPASQSLPIQNTLHHCRPPHPLHHNHR
jgi:hypothetical protein